MALTLEGQLKEMVAERQVVIQQINYHTGSFGVRSIASQLVQRHQTLNSQIRLIEKELEQ